MRFHFTRQQCYLEFFSLACSETRERTPFTKLEELESDVRMDGDNIPVLEQSPRGDVWLPSNALLVEQSSVRRLPISHKHKWCMATFFVNTDGIQLEVVSRDRGIGKDNVIIVSVRVTTNSDCLIWRDVETAYNRESTDREHRLDDTSERDMTTVHDLPG